MSKKAKVEQPKNSIGETVSESVAVKDDIGDAPKSGEGLGNNDVVHIKSALDDSGITINGSAASLGSELRELARGLPVELGTLAQPPESVEVAQTFESDDIGPGDDLILTDGPGKPELAIPYELLAAVPVELIEAISKRMPKVTRLLGARANGNGVWTIVYEYSEKVNDRVEQRVEKGLVLL